VMIYVDTRRPFWSLPLTGAKFVLTGVILGIPAALLVSLLGAVALGAPSVPVVMESIGRTVLRWLLAASLAKLAVEGLVLFHRRDKKQTPLKRTALLLLGELGPVFLGRVVLGLVGGVLLPGLLIAAGAIAGPDGFRPITSGVIVGLILVLTLVGELLERYLFFTAAVAPKMPGAYAP
jgi:formate dehydrogenase iron-sulfur subunit